MGLAARRLWVRARLLFLGAEDDKHLLDRVSGGRFAGGHIGSLRGGRWRWKGRVAFTIHDSRFSIDGWDPGVATKDISPLGCGLLHPRHRQFARHPLAFDGTLS